MDQATGFLNSIEQMPPAKKLVLVIMGIVVVLLILDLISYHNKQSFFNVLNHSNKPTKNNIEKMSTTENDIGNSAPAPAPAAAIPDTSGMVTINLDPEKINLTLFFAEWCGHCRHFMKETWMDLKEALKNNTEIQLNEVNCTDIRGEIKTPAGKSIEGFPSLILNFKNAKGEYLEDEYRGGRSLSNLTVFLEKFTSFIKTN